MLFTKTRLDGVAIVDLDPITDERGFFARAWCAREFEAHGIDSRLAQCNISFNSRRGTLRGMHFQAEPFGEPKTVRCIRGSVFDVVVDIRPDSPTFRQWIAVELTAGNRRMLCIPPGCAHGFQTLDQDSELFYQMGEFYRPDAQRGFRWDDPAFAIEWPLPNPVVSERDRQYPAFSW